MLAAIATLADRIVLARWDDPGVIDTADFPLAPADCEYLELTPELYAALAPVLDKGGRPRFRLIDDSAGSYEIAAQLRDKRFYAITETVSRYITTLDTGVPDFLPDHLELVEISQADFVNMNREGMTHDAELQVMRWSASVDGVVTENEDTRKVLRVAYSYVEPTDTHSITFDLEDSNGVPVPANASRDILVHGPGTTRRCIRVTLSNGTTTVTPALDSGSYVIATAEPTVYRIAGDDQFLVAETWA